MHWEVACGFGIVTRGSLVCVSGLPISGEGATIGLPLAAGGLVRGLARIADAHGFRSQ